MLDKVGILFLNVSLFSLKPYIGEINEKKVSKENGKKILVVSGGVNARALREHFLSNGFDIIALSEGEQTIIQIVDQFSSGKPDYSQVERIAYRQNNKTIITGAAFKKGNKIY